MCGRYSITVDKSTIEYYVNAKFISGQHDFAPARPDILWMNADCVLVQ
jgi:hypothetical protein